MEEHFKCPICGAPGLSDYKRERVVCHVCDTDLSPYMLLAEGGSAAEKSALLVAESEDKFRFVQNRFRYLKFAVVALSLGVLLVVCLVVFLFCERTRDKELLCDAQSQIELPNEHLQSSNTQECNPETIVLTEFKYTVRKGDSFWTISKRFYGTGEYASKVASDNNLTIKDAIHVGDILNIKN